MVRIMFKYILVLVFLLLSIGVIPFSAYSSRVVQIGAYNTLSVALMDNGTVWTWGDKTGPLASSVPVMLDISNVTAMAPGMNFILFLKSDGTVWACGDNRYGELGDGTSTNRYDRVARVGNLSDVKMIAAGPINGMALKNDGTVWMWGYDQYGELGTGTPGFQGGAKYSPYPVQVPVSDVTSITGDDNFFALKGDGTLWGWGRDYDGSLGVDMNDSRVIVWIDDNNNTQAVVTKPIQISLSGVTAISSNSQNTLAIINGTLWAWGDNTFGQLGIGNKATIDRPVKVKGLTDVASAIAATTYSVALESNGTVWAWGQNMEGYLGVPHDDLVTTNTPTMVAGLSNVVQLAGGYDHILALKNDGTVWAWGSNRYDQLGNGGIGLGSSTPAQVLIGSQTATTVTVAATMPAASDTGPLNATVDGQNNGLNTFSIIGLIILVILAGVFAYAFIFRKK